MGNSSARKELLDALLVERFGPPPTHERGAAPSPLGVDDETTIAERQRLLCRALDGRHLVAVEDRRAA